MVNVLGSIECFKMRSETKTEVHDCKNVLKDWTIFNYIIIDEDRKEAKLLHCIGEENFIYIIQFLINHDKMKPYQNMKKQN